MEITTNLTIEKKAIGIEFKALHIVKQQDESLAFIQFEIQFENGTTELFEIRKSGQEFNDYIDSDISIKNLYVEAFGKLGLDPATLPIGSMNESIHNIVQD